MERLSFTILAILSLCLFGCTQQAKRIAQNDADFLAVQDSLRQLQIDHMEWHNAEIAGKYGIPRVKLLNELDEHPERAKTLQPIIDSLTHCMDSLVPISMARLQEIQDSALLIEKKYESISTEGFKGAFMRRHVYSNEKLDSLYEAAPRILKRSIAGQSIKAFLHGPKVWPGDRIITFDCFDVNGEPFDWKTIEGKKTIIVADGLYCWTHGMDDTAPVRYFDSLKKEFGDDFVLMVFCNNCDIAGLKEQSEHFGLENYIVIGDGREFSSPLEIMYDCQYTPSFVLINPDGTLDSMVVENDYIEEFLRK